MKRLSLTGLLLSFLYRMKEISVSDKAELQQLQKQFKEMSNQLSEVSSERDKLQSRLQVCQFVVFLDCNKVSFDV